MKTIIVKTQAELDALPSLFSEYTIIEIHASSRISVTAKRKNSSVEAWGNSSVEAWGNSSVEARGNSSVVARENSSVEAWENSSVEAWGNSSVVARGNVGIHAHSAEAKIVMWGYCVVWLIQKTKIVLKSKTARIIKPVRKAGTREWFNHEGVEVVGGSAILFKRVSAVFKTQEGTANETAWEIGKTLDHPSPDLKGQECNSGKYHFCSRPYFCDEFRSERDDKYIALSVPVKSCYAWPNPQYPHKIAGLKATVLYECDRFGKKKS